MNRILKAYLKRLTNLSTRNKSLLLAGLPAEQFLDIFETDFLLGKSCLEVIQQLVQKKERIPLCDVLDPRLGKSNEVSKKLRKIARTESFIEEERGSRDLYIGYPFVRGKLADGTPIHAPLLFFPVTLRMDREQWCLYQRDEVGVSLNRSFALAYAFFNETVIPDEVLEKSFEDFSKDFLEFRTQLYEWLKQTPFRINFNQDLFEEKLQSFEIWKGSELEEKEQNGELKLYSETVLGIFPQSGSYLVPDYNRLIDSSEEDLAKLTLLNGLDEGYEPLDINEAKPVFKSREEDLLTPFSIDESQEKILLQVKNGQSVVVQGPPGSGKSQLICNLMADFASRGKRVLLVCQKRAALDVVYQRLQSINMDVFTALIHDFKNDRQSLYAQLSLQIEQVESYRQKNYSLDAVFLERQYVKECRQIDRLVEELDLFRSALFDESESGVSIKELYLTSDPNSPHVNLSQEYKSFRMDSWEDFRRKLNTYIQYKLHFPSDFIWKNRRSFAHFGLSDMKAMERMLSDWPGAYYGQEEAFGLITGLSFERNFIQERPEVLERLNEIESLLDNHVKYDLFRAYLKSDTNSYERLAFIRQVSDSLDGFIAEQGLEMSLETKDLPGFREKLSKVVEVKQSAVSGIWWNLFGSEKQLIQQITAANGLSTNSDDLKVLSLKLRNRIELEGWLQKQDLLFKPKYLQENDKKLSYQRFFQDAEAAADAVQRTQLKYWTNILKHIAADQHSLEDFKSKIEALKKWLMGWDTMENAMRPYLLDSQILHLLEAPTTYSDDLQLALTQEFDSMVDMDKLFDEMSIMERTVVEKVLTEADHLYTSAAIIELCENSLKLEWIGHIENKYPLLRSVNSLKMEQWESQIQESILAKQQLSKEIAGIKLREHTYQDIEKNRLGNRVTYRELSHQVNKKRKIWPIRKLLEAYSEEIFTLVPCWMASPEAVSAIFPMQSDLFDLVIFDEASQCYAEYGLPAAFRGKQIVVAGDSKQLAPNDLYKIRYEEKVEEEIPTPALEIESLLDLAAQSFNQSQLTGHYRSSSLDLIDFSNQHFYKNSLKFLPDYAGVNERSPGISYVKVDGVWKNNANQIEVEKVIEILKELQHTDQTIGVVTFNYFQQQAIQEVVEKEGIHAKDLFVKNIENVQGDERDIIIFSMGYAEDEKGRLSMQFGSLNMQGGENRLNVAVTRARKKIYFVTSLWPQQLNTDSLANEGPKVLKAYMQYAQEVSEGRYKPSPVSMPGFRVDWFLREKLLQEKPSLVRELPFADLTIKAEAVYKGLVLTDDDLYYRSGSSKEPHAYLPLLLQNKHWPFSRVYSRQYWTKSIKLTD